MSRRRGIGLVARLRERGVLRVAASYVVIAWLALQVADVILEPWDLPGWVHRAPVVIALLGFPIAIALAWFLEVGAAGVARDQAPPGETRPVSHGPRRYADLIVISVLGATVGYFLARDAGWLGERARPGARVESSSLAVLPFVSVGSFAEPHISEGLSDELRNQFSRMQSLTVTARSSSVAFRDQSLDAVAIATKLAVAVLLEGTVGREGGRLQVSVQLVDGRSGKVLWAERFDRPDQDLLAVQSEIASAVVAAVLPRFAASGQAAPPPPTDDPVAYDLYLLGRQKQREASDALWSGDATAAATGFAQAADRLLAAIVADPGFAQAHATLAGVRLWQALDRIDEASHAEQAAAIDREVMPDIERALKLDPKNAEAYFVKGELLLRTMRPESEAAFRRAVELDPNHAPAILALGWSAVSHGHVDERHRLVLRARDLDPMELRNHTSAIQSATILGRRDELRSSVDRMLRALPDHPGAAMQSCGSWSLLGQPDEALACLELARPNFAGNPQFRAYLDELSSEAWALMGDQARAMSLLERAAIGNPDKPLEVLLWRRDIPALQRLGREALSRRPQLMDDSEIAGALARVGLTDEAVAIYRHAGIADILGSDLRFKVYVMHGVIQLAALLRLQGHDDEAERLIQQGTELNETQRRHSGRSAGIHVAAAKLYALAGRTDQAIEHLGRAADAMDAPAWMEAPDDELEFAELRKDERFKAVVKRVRQMQAAARARLPETFRRHGLAWPSPA